MARISLLPVGLAFLWLIAWGTHPGRVSAAALGSGRPSITITNLHDGSVVAGSHLTVAVSVSNFKLVPPVYVNPPRISGNKGHIHYVLDSLANFVATRDATISLSHTWSGVSPGKHVVFAYLATSQHGRFPGATEARVTVNVVSAGAKAQTAGVASAPRTGGAADAHSSQDLPALLALALMCLALGGILLRTVEQG